ncbi:MAG: cupin domain-containing protein [Gammaproteobacteria bacterium]
MNCNQFVSLACTAGLALWHASSVAAEPGSSPPAAIVKQLFDSDQTGVPGKELLMLTVEYVAGGASLPHRHDAQVFVYVLEGEVKMQVAGGPVLTLHPGQTFYESPSDVHSVSANASKTKPAKILVFIVKDKGAPVTREVEPTATP